MEERPLKFDKQDSGDLARDTGRRLRLSRLALRIADQKAFGEGAGLQQSLYTRFESGRRLLTLSAALQLCNAYQLTLDWLYRGDASGLPYRLARAIVEQNSEPS